MTKNNYIRFLQNIFNELPLADRDDTAAQIDTMLRLGMISESEAPAYAMALQPLIENKLLILNSLDPVPSPEEIYPHKEPDLIIGELMEGSQDVPVGFFLHDSMNCIFAGNAGSGTTTGMYNLALAVDTHNKKYPRDFISMIIWETKDGSLTAIAKIISDCILVNTKTLRISTQPPKGYPQENWYNELGTIIGHRRGLEASIITIIKILKFLAAVMSASIVEKLYPSIENAYEVTEIAPPKLFASKEPYMLSANQVLHQIAKGTGDLFRAHRSTSLEDIIEKKKHLLIDVRGMSPPWTVSVAADILHKGLLLGRQYRGESNPDRCIIIRDEADAAVSRQAEAQYGGMLPESEISRQGRSSRISQVLRLSALGPASRTILVDANYHFIGRFKDHESLREAANTLVLPKGAEAILPSLSPGEFLFRGPQWPSATLAKIFPNFLPPIPKDIHYDTLPYVASRSIRQMPHVMAALRKLKAEKKNANLNIGGVKQDELDEKVLAYLSLACDLPGFPTKNIFQQMGKISSNVQRSILKKLIGKKLIETGIWRIEKSDKQLQQVQPAAYKLVKKPEKKLKGKGSVQHCNGMLWVQSNGIKQGFEKSVCEFQILGTLKSSDVVYFNGDYKNLHLFEVIFDCWKNLPEKIKAAFDSVLEIEKFIIVAGRKSQLKKIELFLHSELPLFPDFNKIHFEVITPYLEDFLKGYMAK